MQVRTKYIFLAVVFVVAALVYTTFSQPGVNDLPGDFREIDALQNENNTGPVHRRYIVTVSDSLWAEMETYGNYMPYAKLGTTNVWFFLSSQPYPSKVSAGTGAPFASIYEQACLARYEKDNMGMVRLVKYPFR